MSNLPGAPSWMVNPEALRRDLERLSTLLARPQVARAHDTIPLPYSRDSILDTLVEVLEAVGALDARAYETTAAVGSKYRPAAEAERLRELVASLRDSWRQRFKKRLGPEKTRCLIELLNEPTPDFLSIVNHARNENSHSDVLCWLLDPRRSPVFAPHALRGLFSFLDKPQTWTERVQSAVDAGVLSIRRECVTGREGDGDSLNQDRVDLLLSGPDFALVIENKIFSSEHNRQTERYWDWMQSFRTGLLGGLFLSPDGVSPCCPSFKALSYLDLVDCLLEGPTRTQGALPPSERIVLSSYLKTLGSDVLRIELRAAGVREE